jgi:chemotaxis protein histidine kinase CheA
VQSWGGTLSLEKSTPGVGSVFALILPLSRSISGAQLAEADTG